MTGARIALGVLTAVVFLYLGFTMLSVQPRVAALLLALGLLRGILVGRQVWNEWGATPEPPPPSPPPPPPAQ